MDVSDAQLVICGLGFFQATINGISLDENYFKPLVTDYDFRDKKRNPAMLLGNRTSVCVYEYDVAQHLNAGENVLEITLGNGYYHNEDRPEEPYVSYGDKKAIFELRITDRTGEKRITSDSQSDVRYLNVHSGLYTGDSVDFSAGHMAFTKAVLAPAPNGRWRKPTMPADKVSQVLLPERSWEQAGTVYDFGINHSGGVAFTVIGKPGQKIHLQFAEVLNEDGTLNMKTSRWEEISGSRLLHRIDQAGTYILSGGEDKVEPYFSWHCYRYVRVIGAEGAEIQNMRSLYIHTDIPQTGDMECAEPIFTEIHEKFCRTAYNNLHAGLLTDCPHREKRCYTGDGQIIAEALLYEMDAACFFGKWLQDLCDAQTSDGFIPYTVPYMSGGGGYAWSSAIVVVPEVLYRYTGDLQYVHLAYPAVQKWVDYCNSHATDHIITSGEQEWLLGDWLTPDITGFHVQLMSTLWYYRGVATAEWFAELMNKPEDAKTYRSLKQQIADAINETFFDRDRLCYCRGIQGENVLPLAFGVVPKEYEAAMQKGLRQHYQELGYHLDTGIVATPFLLEYLTEHGMEDIAYKLMTQRDYPSYHYMLDGETTIPEHWSKMWPDYFVNDTKYVKGGGDVSHCHPMFGSVVAWLYKRVVGLDVSSFYKGRVRFAPKLTGYLEYARGKTRTPVGEAAIDWKTVPGGMEVRLSVPDGLKGEFVAPAGAVSITAKNAGNTLTGIQKILLDAGQWEITVQY